MSGMTQPKKSRLAIKQADYQRLSEFRYLIRRFLEFSQIQAEDAGLTTRQHQALLAIKGFPSGGPVTIGDVAERLRIRHHSAVELVNRLGEAGLVVRDQDKDDHRRVLLRLTERAEDCLAELSAAHLDELSRIEPMLRRLLVRDGD
ncbi:helix-turn-helix domain-containing protein [Mesorhizobium sp.]|uniref:MarR family winged helix-turn-helix transcriptional regulator n=1 Tax=Mesorhizobium sp. TaxID=1871066 RepID=UPI000FE8A2A9|nr:helix-turn-helix domain-containing protein [Mesorhizobium sp.]RWE72734.1 MAG: MarR family transcriptional regulator [Mesorhizobium sp.]TIV30390.1 MAG: winged helix-turn-helix transcriptional regulator [Mesorhizobium sp.]